MISFIKGMVNRHQPSLEVEAWEIIPISHYDRGEELSYWVRFVSARVAMLFLSQLDTIHSLIFIV